MKRWERERERGWIKDEKMRERERLDKRWKDEREREREIG